MNGEEPIALESSPTMDFSCLAEEEFSQKFEEKKSLIEESEKHRKCTINGSINDMMKILKLWKDKTFRNILLISKFLPSF